MIITIQIYYWISIGIYRVSLPKFLVIRFAPGSGANFLTSVLQCSPQVGHWRSDLEHNRSNADWLEYFAQSFSPDFDNWLINEPVANQRLGTREIFSAWYDRGNDLSVTEFNTLEQKYCSELYFELKLKDSFIPIYWHKSIFPAYFSNATFINIVLDRASLKWFDRSLYKKHYKVVSQQDRHVIVQHNRHRPSIVPQSFKGSNEFRKTYCSFKEFIRDEIISNPWREFYQSPKFDSGGRPEYSLALGDLLNFTRFKKKYKQLCDVLVLTPVNDDLLEQLHTQWRSCHDY